MNKAIVFGNGESRKWAENVITFDRHDKDVITWGCNAIYRDMWVDNLVAVDFPMQQEIYTADLLEGQFTTGDTMRFHFTNWSPVPAEIADMMFMGYDIPESFIHKTERVGNHTEQCVISGKDPVTLQEKIEVAIKMNPDLNMKDLRAKMEKDVGIWITYVKEDDGINTIDYPVGWAAGNTALHLACQEGANEVYIVGFDLSSYDEPLNNIYKGTDNYLSSDAKGFNSVNWKDQMQTVFEEFKDVKFYWVDARDNSIQENNLSYLTKTDFCDTLKIL